MAHVAKQVQLVAEPLDDFGDLALVVLGFLAAARGLRQALSDLSGAERFAFGGAAGQRGGIAGGVGAQVRNGLAEALDHGVEDLHEDRQMVLLAEGGEKARPVVGLGNLLFVLDANQESEGGIALQFRETSINRLVPQRDGEEQRAPENADGIIVAPFASSLAKREEPLAIGDRFEQKPERRERRGILERVPGEPGFGDADVPGNLAGRSGGEC